VSGISPHGIWLWLGDREVFMPFTVFPWFREAPVAGVLHVERPQPHHLYWPDLDIDLAVDSIDHPERYPLVSRDRPAGSSRRPAGAKGGARRGAGKSRTSTSRARSPRAGAKRPSPRR
jgi:hypothetical protein